ncbi:hypothetical protein [Halomonas elongata]|uniref:Uncharacterized protein n=1 Tax=Halomonas elongata (strain ATCC 33173 / DSM 2581 / NBRC 15536 / NCIMB 2198 / 1H9) TaxID=768066 RepID=E1VA37_HALED|nr:hypothetical protein [Halomonas elongata]WBF17666.1 hypothetical protein LM502_16560 [Halomonas elongata]WPU46507.1 hypothetical protein SR933_14795 [Halomonas elongata DSM 2581]CBV43925.1 uncharacterized protein HELO_4041 [Halomonas elongata DSM 2581]
MSGKQHTDLVQRGARWLRGQGFPVIATEIRAIGCREEPDVIGFRESCSAIIEAKASRADFRADRHKPERQSGGLGVYRFYLAPPDLIHPKELPHGWGLLVTSGRGVAAVVKPTGNWWPGIRTPPHLLDNEWGRFIHAPDQDAERAVLFSIARRASQQQKQEVF